MKEKKEIIELEMKKRISEDSSSELFTDVQTVTSIGGEKSRRKNNKTNKSNKSKKIRTTKKRKTLRKKRT